VALPAFGCASPTVRGQSLVSLHAAFERHVFDDVVVLQFPGRTANYFGDSIDGLPASVSTLEVAAGLCLADSRRFDG
jgi:hypothetical protein